jgi:heme a synthase
LTRTTHDTWLHRFAVLTALATLALLGAGGLVTSHGAGMAVPDWPNTYGYNMFLFPPSKWVGGIFYEHTHRLLASGVGLLTTVLAVWLWLKESRAWLRWLGVIAFFSVVLQGVLGGLRVVLFKDEIGIFHATLAQLFFALVCAIALFTSRWWQESERRAPARHASDNQTTDPLAETVLGAPTLRGLFLIATILIFLQLVLGSTMRHQHAGLAIPDFPLAYGSLWPATDADSVARYNQQRVEVVAANPITTFQIVLQMAHRLMALVILVCVVAVAWRARRWNAEHRLGVFPAVDIAPRRCSALPLQRLAFVWLALILTQAGLGAWTIWSNKAADVATAHVLVGALSLVTGVLGCIICFRRPTVAVGTLQAATSLEASRGNQYRVDPAAALNQ